MLVGRDLIAACIPHDGAMCLWETVQSWDSQRIVLTSTSHRAVTNPLRHADQLHSVTLCEYAAQAMAVHGGLLAKAGGQTARQAGLLAALYDVCLHVDRIDTLEGLLCCDAECLARNSRSTSYAFKLMHEQSVLVTGRATVHLSAEKI